MNDERDNGDDYDFDDSSPGGDESTDSRDDYREQWKEEPYSPRCSLDETPDCAAARWREDGVRQAVETARSLESSFQRCGDYYQEVIDSVIVERGENKGLEWGLAGCRFAEGAVDKVAGRLEDLKTMAIEDRNARCRTGTANDMMPGRIP